MVQLPGRLRKNSKVWLSISYERTFLPGTDEISSVPEVRMSDDLAFHNVATSYRVSCSSPGKFFGIGSFSVDEDTLPSPVGLVPLWHRA